MNKNYLITIMLFSLAIAPTVNAQRKKEAMPDEGYWVISHNKKTPRQSVVYYFNTNNEVIHQQTISGRKLNVKRRKIVRELNSVLLQSVTAWNNRKADKKEDWAVKE